MREPLRLLEPDGTLTPGAREPEVPGKDLRRLYRLFVRARVVDEALLAAQREGRIPFYLAGAGEEAVSLGGAAGLRETDWIFAGPRDTAALFLRGMDPGSYLRLWLQGRFGFTGELQGAGEVRWREARCIPFSSPGPARIPQAVGFAWAGRMRGEDLAVLVSFGEAATSHGDFHAGMNFAGVFRAPVVFVCRNNRGALPEDWPRQTASETVAAKAEAYGFSGARVDGADLLAVREAVREAADRARNGEGPALVEALTSREAAAAPGRARRALEEGDPAFRLRRYLVLKGLWSDAEEAALWEELRRHAEEAVSAPGGPLDPPVGSLFENLYERLPRHLAEQLAELRESLEDADRGGRRG